MKKFTFGFDKSNLPERPSKKGEDGKPVIVENYKQEHLDAVNKDIAQATTEERKKALEEKRIAILNFLGNKNVDLN